MSDRDDELEKARRDGYAAGVIGERALTAHAVSVRETQRVRAEASEAAHASALRALEATTAERDSLRAEVESLRESITAELHVKMAAVVDPSVRSLSAAIDRAQKAEAERDEFIEAWRRRGDELTRAVQLRHEDHRAAWESERSLRAKLEAGVATKVYIVHRGDGYCDPIDSVWLSKRDAFLYVMRENAVEWQRVRDGQLELGHEYAEEQPSTVYKMTEYISGAADRYIPLRTPRAAVDPSEAARRRLIACRHKYDRRRAAEPDATPGARRRWPERRAFVAAEREYLKHF